MPKRTIQSRKIEGTTVYSMPQGELSEFLAAFGPGRGNTLYAAGATPAQARRMVDAKTPLEKRIAAEHRALLSRADAAAMFQMSVSEWARLESGVLPEPVMVGGRKRWRLTDLEAFAAGGCRARVGKGKTPHPEILKRANLTPDEIAPGLSEFYAAKLCGMSETEFGNAVAAGVAPPPRILSGGRERWPEETLRAWIAGGCKPVTSETP